MHVDLEIVGCQLEKIGKFKKVLMDSPHPRELDLGIRDS